LRRKSWVMAMPMDAKAREVRSHERNVRSVKRQSVGRGRESGWPKRRTRTQGKMISSDAALVLQLQTAVLFYRFLVPRRVAFLAMLALLALLMWCLLPLRSF
jgi:hypothetical protein